MSNIRYPSALDNVDNLPTVRDNLTDIGSDIINRLRDAVLAIERTLGTTPQGNFSTLVDRISAFTNADGTLRKSAFEAIGGLFGPIVDDDVDINAKISESKIALNFPTNLLQDEIKILEQRNAGLVDLALSVRASLNTHIGKNSAVDPAHHAISIKVDPDRNSGNDLFSDEATKTLPSGDLQSLLETIYNSHINFRSSNITSGNSSHTASQIHYDDTISQLSTTSVQGAIDSLATSGAQFSNAHQQVFHSNGVLGRVNRLDPHNSSSVLRGKILFGPVLGNVEFPNTSNSLDNTIYINFPLNDSTGKYGYSLTETHEDLSLETIIIHNGDDVILTDISNVPFGIVSITDIVLAPETNLTNTEGNLIGLRVLYDQKVFNNSNKLMFIDDSSLVEVYVTIARKTAVSNNPGALATTVRRLSDTMSSELTTSYSEIQVNHPNTATVISSGFSATSLARRADGMFDRDYVNTLSIIIDDDSVATGINVVPSSPVDVTLDTVVAKTNNSFYENNLPLVAFRHGNEFGISLVWPEESNTNTHTFRIVSGDPSTDASSALGLSSIVDTTIIGASGHDFVVNGKKLSSINVKLSLTGSSEFTLSSPTRVNFLNINPAKYGVREGDLISLEDLETSSTLQDGIRRVSAVGSDYIDLYGDSFNLDLESTSTSTLKIYANGLQLDNVQQKLQHDFEGLLGGSTDPTQNAILQIYINEEGIVDYHERLIYSDSLIAKTIGAPPLDISSGAINTSSSGSGIYIIDVSRSLYGTPSGLNKLISFQFDGYQHAYATLGCVESDDLDPILHGPTVEITGDGVYNLFDETGLDYITIKTIKAFSLVSVPSFTAYRYTLPLYIFEQINEFKNLLLCNVYYNSATNKVPILQGELALQDKRYFGSIGAEQIRSDVIGKYIEGVFNETRSNGVVSGLTVPSDPNGTGLVTDRKAYVNGGVVYINGIRYEIPSQVIYVDPSTRDISQYDDGTGIGYIKYYIIVDSSGRLQTSEKLYLSGQQQYVPLAKVVLQTSGIDVDNNPVVDNGIVVDFRYFISSIDEKIDLTVSPLEQRACHFHSISAALEYIDALRSNDMTTGVSSYLRPTTIKLLEGTYQELTTLNIPPYVTINGESSRSVRILPPVRVNSGNDNKYIFSLNMLPEGVSIDINNVCFDCNATNISGRTFAGALDIRWFDNITSAETFAIPFTRFPSQVNIKNCLFMLDGTVTNMGISTTFGVALPAIVGGLVQYSSSYDSIFDVPYFSNYSNYDFAATNPSDSIPSLPSPLNPTPPTPVSSTQASNPGTPSVPANPSGAVFYPTASGVPATYDHGGIQNINNNTFICSDATLFCIDRFYDTSGNTVPVANYRVKALKINDNTFSYSGNMTSTNVTVTIPAKVSSSMFVANTIPAQVDISGTSIRDQIYHRMIHREIRGYDAISYPNLSSGAHVSYPDPYPGITFSSSPNGIPYTNWVPATGGRLNENIIISGNTPSALNLANSSAIRIATDSLDSPSRENHGGGTIFANVVVPGDGTPVIIDRSIDWHDRYIYSYANNALDALSVASVPTALPSGIYKTSNATKQLNTGFSVWYFDSLDNEAVVNTPDLLGRNGGQASSQGITFGYGASLTGAQTTITNPSGVIDPITDWTTLRYVGMFNLSLAHADTSVHYEAHIALLIMPNGALAALHAGSQYVDAPSSSTLLIQTSDQVPGGSGTSSSTDPTREAFPMWVSFVITYSPKLNVSVTMNNSLK